MSLLWLWFLLLTLVTAVAIGVVTAYRRDH